jgi:hypothetical protein
VARREAQQRSVAQAYHTASFAALAFVGKLKPLETYLPKEEDAGGRSGRQTVQQQKSMLGMLSERLGIPLRRRRRGDEPPS